MSFGQIFLIVIAVIALGLMIAFWEKVKAFCRGAKEFWGEVVQELKKVSWPARNAVISSTIMVGVLTIALTFIIGGVDLVFGKVVGWIFTGN